MIPTPIIEHFLTETFCRQQYRGFPILPIQFQSLENAALRAFYGMHAKQTGVRIRSVDHLSDAFTKLKPDDILLEIDSLPVSNEGTVDIPGIGNCIDLVHVTHMKYIGDAIHLKILRKDPASGVANVHNVSVILDRVPLETEKGSQEEFDKMPTYYIASGIVFIPLTRNYLDGNGADLENCFLVEEGCYLPNAPKNFLDDQIIVVNDILDCKETEGYGGYINAIVNEINGKPIRNMKDVVTAIESNHQAQHIITTRSRKVIAVENMSKEKHHQLLKHYHIPKDRSDDLLSSQSENRLSVDIPMHASSTTTAQLPEKHRRMESSESEEPLERSKHRENLPGQKKYQQFLEKLEERYQHLPPDQEVDLDVDWDALSSEAEEYFSFSDTEPEMDDLHDEEKDQTLSSSSVESSDEEKEEQSTKAWHHASHFSSTKAANAHRFFHKRSTPPYQEAEESLEPVNKKRRFN